MPRPKSRNRTPRNTGLSPYANKRSEHQIELDRTQIAHWYLKGDTQAAIAERLNISRSQVSLDLKVIQTRWKEAAIRDFDEHKAEQLARLDAVEREYWTAWELSKQTKKRISRKMIAKAVEKQKKKENDEKEKREFETVEANEATENQCGDPRFLAGVESCIDKRCRIFGIYAPTKINLDDLDTLIAKELERVAGNHKLEDEPLASDLTQ